MKHKILFVCHGNICRSPMAEFIMKRLVSEVGREAEFEIDSVATSTEEIGNDMYPPARRCLRAMACRSSTGALGKSPRPIMTTSTAYS